MFGRAGDHASRVWSLNGIGGQSPRIFLKALSVKAILLYACPFQWQSPLDSLSWSKGKIQRWTHVLCSLPPQEMRTSEHNSTSSRALEGLLCTWEAMERPWPWHPLPLPGYRHPLTHEERL